jgi:thiol-disulfide isomerase/thioredoxin
MARRTKWLLVSGGVLAVAAAAAAWFAPWPLREGATAPGLDVQWLQGEPFDPRNAGGEIVVVELWATWCGPCMGQIPEIDALQRRYASRGVRVVAVAVWDELDRVQRFVAERGPSLAYSIAFDRHGQVQKQWRENWLSNGIPCSFLVGPDGKVAAITHPTTLDRTIASMVAGKWPPATQDMPTSIWEEAWSASDAKDWPTLERVADRILVAAPAESSGWVWKARAQRTPEAAAQVAARALTAVREDPLEIADLVLSLAADGRLLGVAEAANAAMLHVPANTPGLFVPLARLRAAHALGGEALATATASVLQHLAAQPHDLLLLAQKLLRRAPAGDGVLAFHPPRQPMLQAGLRLVDAATPALGAARVAEVQFQLLVEAGAEPARVDAVGRDAVAAQGSPGELNSFAWGLLLDTENLALTRKTALLAAEAMTRTTGWDTPNNLDTLALARFENGDVDGAIEMQQRAIAAAPDASAAFRQRLDRYRQAKQAASPATR